MIKLIATDLDGTLVHDTKMGKEDRRALLDVISMGIPVIPVTTRMRHSSSEILRGIPIFQNPLICMNGAVVKGPGWEDKYCESWMKKTHRNDIAETISSYIDEKGYEVTTVFDERKCWRVRDGQKPGSDTRDPVTWLIEKNHDALEYGLPISYMIHEDGNGVEAMSDLERLAKTNCNDSVTIHRHHRMGTWVALTIYPYGVNKENALKLVCDKVGISMENVLAIGNDEVDKRMLRSAGVGVAMGNAPEHIKDVADDVAPACTEDGVSWALKKYVL
ncbi:MAG: HAD family hydrolase [Thermoplasmata archaeon]